MGIKDEYTASDVWQGGVILVTGTGKQGYGIEQAFGAGRGPLGRGGIFPLGYQKTRKAALAEARIHARARKAPLYLEQETDQ